MYDLFDRPARSLGSLPRGSCQKGHHFQRVAANPVSDVGVDRHAGIAPRGVCLPARLAAQCRCVSVSNELLDLTASAPR